MVATLAYLALIGTPAPVPMVLQGTVTSVSGNILAMEFHGTRFPSGRQVSIASAEYQASDGRPVSKFKIWEGLRLIIVVDPNAPTTYRPPRQPGRPHPNFVRLLPLKALVVEETEH
ncbi:MAG TPA: hypothetical protein VG944_16390 [Fimbriimonas sp.]|nr:hypothetical protein [Fimbriimonas sp.]